MVAYVAGFSAAAVGLGGERGEAAYLLPQSLPPAPPGGSCLAKMFDQLTHTLEESETVLGDLADKQWREVQVLRALCPWEPPPQVSQLETRRRTLNNDPEKDPEMTTAVVGAEGEKLQDFRRTHATALPDS